MKNKFISVVIFFTLASVCFGQQNTSWTKWQWLIGDWKGEGSGQPGQGGGTFSFKLDLDNKVLVRKSHAEYPAVGNKPKISHDDLMVTYLDETGNPSKAIYFDNEGHTINYSISFADSQITFTSNKSANVPVFQLTYNLFGKDFINTKFEMSRDGVTFMMYVEGKSRRIK